MVLWRTLTRPPAVTVDGWAYAAWGQAVLRGERPLFDLGYTTPKPLAVALGSIVAPLPPQRAFAVVVAVALGAVAASLFAAAYRDGGPVAAVVALAVLVLGVAFNSIAAFAYVDAVVTALVLAAIALRGRLRIGALVLAGLLRPEAWVLAAVGGFSESAGSLTRRVGHAVLAGAIAPVLWVVSDLVLMGDPLGTSHWRRDAPGTETTRAWLSIPGDIWGVLSRHGGALVVFFGVAGLCVHFLKSRREGRADPLPLAVLIVWTLFYALETRTNGILPGRYLLPVVGVLALGCGLLVAPVLQTWLGRVSVWPAVAAGAVVLVVAVLATDPPPNLPRSTARNAALLETRPVIESALSCGKVGTTRGSAAQGVIPQLAAASRRSLHEFGIYPRGGPYAAVLDYRPRWQPGREINTLPPWALQETALGPLAVAPGCGPLSGP
jgi:hypothetical protein